MLIAVESSGYLFFELLNFTRVIRGHHSLSQFSQLASAQLPALLQFVDELDHDCLLVLRQVLNIINDLRGSHQAILLHSRILSNPAGNGRTIRPVNNILTTTNNFPSRFAPAPALIMAELLNAREEHFVF